MTPPSASDPGAAPTSVGSASPLGALFDSHPLGLATGVLLPGPALRILQVNPAFQQITGFTQAECAGRAPSDLVLRSAGLSLGHRIALDLSRGIQFSDTLRCTRSDGSLFWGRLLCHVTGADGWALTLENVDAAHETLISLRQHEEQYRLLAANSRDMILMLRFDGTCTYVSPAIETMLGRAPATLINQPWDSIFHGEDAQLLHRILERHLHRQPENLFTHRLRHADGTLLWCETTTRTIWGIEGQQPGSLIAITRDISKRRSAERELQEMHLLLSSVFDSVPLGLCITSSTGRIVQSNLGFAQALGFTPAEICGRIVENLLPADLLRPGSRDGTCQRSSGQTFPVHINVITLSDGPGGNTLITLADQTERLSLESRLREAERLESLGTLAGGVAHDFNNLLAIILGYAGFLRQTAPDNERVAEIGDTIIDAGRRGADVVRQLMLYANQHEPLLADTDVHALVANTLVRVAESWPDRIRIDCDYAATRPVVSVDQDQLGRAMEHLLRNAREAITGTGSVCLRTCERPAAPSDQATNPGGWLELSVIDDGCGMDESTRARMFEPFFSRNKGPEVRGLGLAIVYGIVRAHRGRIEVDSSPGRGTRISLLLPRPATPAAPASSGTYQESNYSLRGAATILLIEDEPDIGRLWQELLTREGWTVHWARDGAQAIALFELHGPRIQLVFSDIGLPGDLNGWELAARFRSARPEMPIVLASGFFQRSVSAQTTISEPVAFIDKPYLVPDVLARLHQMLAGA